MRVYASDVQSRLLRAYLFQLPSASSESMAHSEIGMTREIRDVSYVVNCLVDGGKCHASMSKLLGMHQTGIPAKGHHGGSQ